MNVEMRSLKFNIAVAVVIVLALVVFLSSSNLGAGASGVADTASIRFQKYPPIKM
jgi:hypothetical protein